MEKLTISEQWRAVAEAAAEMGQMLGSTPGGHCGQLDPDRVLLGLGSRQDAYGSFDMSTYMGGRVKLEIHNMTLDDARELARWIASRNTPLGHKGG